jgi:glycosyltransferase involved in cell wall biosynthesis
VFSETFVSNEILYLNKHGIQGCIWYEVPGQGSTQPQHQKIDWLVLRVPQKIFSTENFLPIIISHFYWLLKNPIGYFGCYWFMIRYRWFFIRAFIKAPLVARNTPHSNCIYVHEADNAYFFGKMTALLLRLPIGIIFHTYFLFYKTQFLKVKILASDFCVYQSIYSQKLTESYFRKVNHITSQAYYISSPGVDISFFRPKIKKRYKNDSMEIITIGRLAEAKGYHLLLPSLKIIHDKGYTFRLTIIGYGELEESLKQLSLSLGLSKFVHFAGQIGHSSQLIKLMERADIFILPSIKDKDHVHDVHPNALKEAMAMKLLCLTSNLGGIDEVIEDRKNGFIFSKTTPSEIAASLETVFSLSQSQKIMIGEKARETIEELYESDKMGQTLINLLKKYAFTY